MIYAKSRDKALETETEILRDRDETWDLRDRDFKNGSRDASRDRDQVSRLHHWSQQPYPVFPFERQKDRIPYPVFCQI